MTADALDRLPHNVSQKERDPFAEHIKRLLREVPKVRWVPAIVAAIRSAGLEGHMLGRLNPHRDGVPKGEWASIIKRVESAGVPPFVARKRRRAPRGKPAVKKSRNR